MSEIKIGGTFGYPDDVVASESLKDEISSRMFTWTKLI